MGHSYLADIHCHLHFAPHRKHDVQGAGDSRVVLACCNATNENDWESVLAISSTQPRSPCKDDSVEHSGLVIVPALGVHPWFAHQVSRGWAARLRQLLVAHPEAAVGEIGLDFLPQYKGYAETQLEVLTTCLELAKELGRPAMVHVVRAWGAFHDLVRELSSQDKLPSHFLIHGYSGSPQLVPQFVKHGAYLSFGRGVTESRDDGSAKFPKVIGALSVCPRDRIVLETDGPSSKSRTESATDCCPNAFDSPQGVCLVASAVAKALGSSYESVAETTYTNSVTFLHHLADS